MSLTAFPEVGKYSFSALKRYCTGKDRQATIAYLRKVWNSDALRIMMMVSFTNSVEELAEWLIAKDTDEKLIQINNNSNLFK